MVKNRDSDKHHIIVPNRKLRRHNWVPCCRIEMRSQ